MVRFPTYIFGWARILGREAFFAQLPCSRTPTGRGGPRARATGTTRRARFNVYAHTACRSKVIAPLKCVSRGHRNLYGDNVTTFQKGLGLYKTAYFAKWFFFFWPPEFLGLECSLSRFSTIFNQFQLPKPTNCHDTLQPLETPVKGSEIKPKHLSKAQIVK